LKTCTGKIGNANYSGPVAKLHLSFHKKHPKIVYRRLQLKILYVLIENLSKIHLVFVT
jgi:hypothetical protein